MDNILNSTTASVCTQNVDKPDIPAVVMGVTGFPSAREWKSKELRRECSLLTQPTREENAGHSARVTTPIRKFLEVS